MDQIVYKFDKVNRYLTRGINNDLPIEVQIVLWDMIDNLVKSEKNTDYLQVFRFQFKGNRFFIHHSQEQPQYQKSYEYEMKDEYYPLLKKVVYVIDDITHCTMLFSNEY